MPKDKPFRLNIRFLLIAMIGAGLVFALNRTGSFEMISLKVGEEITYRQGWPITHIEVSATTSIDQREALLNSGWPENRYALIQSLPFTQNVAIWLGIALGIPLLLEIVLSPQLSSSKKGDEKSDG